MHKKAIELIQKWDININPRNLVSDITISQKQLVEILRNLALKPKVLIMDEPTSSLGFKEIQSLFNMINYIKSQGVAIIYISHILDEVFSISDRITVLRDGKNRGTYITKETSTNELVLAMLAKSSIEDKKVIASERVISDEIVLELKNLNRKGVLNNINLKLHKGEILGITGLLGSGKTELTRAIVGQDKIDCGEIYINQKNVKIKSIRDAMNNGIGLIPEDRRRDGIFRLMSIKDNLTFLILKTLTKFGLINMNKQSKVCNDYSKSLDIKFEKLSQIADELSGGNQQKVVIGRWLATNPKFLIADEPTRGIDIGTKFEIYTLLKKLAKEGKSVILLSEETDEVLNLSDRILVMSKGRIIREFEKNEVTREELVKSVIGLKNNNRIK